MSEYIKLENQLCFPLYALSRQITSYYRPMLDAMGLTYPQYLVMMVLWDKGESTVKELGQMLWLDSGTLTPLLKRMETSELITRKRSLTDERLVVISITAKGRLLEAEAEKIPPHIKCQLGMSDDEIVSLRDMIKSVLKTDLTIE